MSASSPNSLGPQAVISGRLRPKKTPAQSAARPLISLLLAISAIALLARPAPAQTAEPDQFLDQPEAIGQAASDAFESIKTFFDDPRVETGVVVILVVLGLTLWLLGARAGRLLFALLLGVAAVVPGMYLADVLQLPLWPGAIVGGLLGMLIGVLIFRVGIMLVGLCISILLALGVFAVVSLEDTEWVDLRNAVQDWMVKDSPQDVQTTPYSRTSTDQPEQVSDDRSERLYKVLEDLMYKYRGRLWVAAITGLAVGLLLQIFARSFMLILTTSCLGTVMILGGVCLGLTNRGYKLEEFLGLKPTSSVVIFLVMLGLGILAQFTMTRRREIPEPEAEEE